MAKRNGTVTITVSRRKIKPPEKVFKEKPALVQSMGKGEKAAHISGRFSN